MTDPDRHRADDDIDALTSGSSYRTPNGEIDLLDEASASLRSDPDAPDKYSAAPRPDRQARLEARLAKRTNKVMSAYKSYLAQIQTDVDDVVVERVPKIRHRGDGDNDCSFINIEVGRPPFRDRPLHDEDDGNPFPSPSEYKDGLVQRSSWTYRREHSSDPPELDTDAHQDTTFLDYQDIRSKFGIEADDDCNASSSRNTPYKYPVLHSRRIRRGLLLLFVTVAIVIGIGAGVARSKRKTDLLPDWEAELAQIQKEEQEKHHAAHGEATAAVDTNAVNQKPPASDTVEGIRPPDETGGDGESTTATTNDKDASAADSSSYSYKDIAAKFGPIAFDRSKGWDGTTYADAVEFCNDLEDHSLCPYEAVCPLGPSSKPAGGYKATGSWLAISDEQNGWVHLGSLDSCTKYEETYSETPDWGWTGKEETTKNIMCCRITEDSPKVTVVISEETAETIAPTEKATVAAEPLTEEEVVTSEETAETIAPTEKATAAAEPLTDEEKQQIQNVSNKLQPIYYNRSHGWEGRTYSQALEFCASMHSRVPCPYTAVCPNGEGRPPLGGVKDDVQESFVPIIDSPNSWVQLSSRGVCELFSSLYGSPPEWGLTGENNEEMTRYIVCCKEPSGSFDAVEDATPQEAASSSSTEAEPADTAGTVAAAAGTSESSSLTSAEQSVLNIMHPLWFGRKHGYQGTTYDDAVEFCKNVGGMNLCPLEAYCPNGPDVKDRPPLFLEMDAFDGEQWAPTSAHSNSWILVGTSDGDDTSTCKTHEELHGGKTPTWGEDGTFTRLKENVMCCVNPSYMSDEYVSGTVDADSSQTAANNSPTTVTTIDNALDIEQIMQTQMKPLWLGEAEGWTGGTHEDAMAFCNTIRGKQLCPYSAYCPHGAGQPVMGRHKVDFNAEGELYAPVFGTENHWVMIGQKGENSATTCMSHYQLEGSNPAWGLTTENPERKKYVMCCTMNTSG